MLAVPEDDGVNVKLQEAVPEVVLGAMEQMPEELKLPAAEPEALKVTVPVGVVGFASISVTVTVHVEAA